MSSFKYQEIAGWTTRFLLKSLRLGCPNFATWGTLVSYYKFLAEVLKLVHLEVGWTVL